MSNEGIKPCSADEDVCDSDENTLAILEPDEEAIDSMLDNKAKETGLSAFNVKSIIKVCL